MQKRIEEGNIAGIEGLEVVEVGGTGLSLTPSALRVHLKGAGTPQDQADIINSLAVELKNFMPTDKDKLQPPSLGRPDFAPEKDAIVLKAFDDLAKLKIDQLVDLRGRVEAISKYLKTIRYSYIKGKKTSFLRDMDERDKQRINLQLIVLKGFYGRILSEIIQAEALEDLNKRGVLEVTVHSQVGNKIMAIVDLLQAVENRTVYFDSETQLLRVIPGSGGILRKGPASSPITKKEALRKIRDATHPSDVLALDISTHPDPEVRIQSGYRYYELKRRQERNRDGDNNSNGQTSSPVGGIDFVNINLICQPMGNFGGLSLNLPKITDIENFDFSEKLTQIKNLLRAEKVPNGERFEELLAACFALKAQEAFLGDIVYSILESCRAEEELALESSPETREAMLLAEAM